MYELFSPDKSDITTNAIKFHGNISAIADHYKVSRETVYQYLYRNPDSKEIIEYARQFNTESDLDLAEKVVRYNMQNYEQNPGLAQRAAEKVIDKKGHQRGWESKEEIKQTTYYLTAHNDLAAGSNIPTQNIPETNNKSPE